jgi:hypothetical protein
LVGFEIEQATTDALGAGRIGAGQNEEQRREDDT